MTTARAVVAGKLRNSRSVLLRGAREAADPAEAQTLTRAADALAASLRAVPGAPDLDTLRGFEGEAATRLLRRPQPHRQTPGARRLYAWTDAPNAPRATASTH